MHTKQLTILLLLTSALISCTSIKNLWDTFVDDVEDVVEEKIEKIEEIKDEIEE